MDTHDLTTDSHPRDALGRRSRTRVARPNDEQGDLITTPELRGRLGNASVASIYRWIARGVLPRPYRVGSRTLHSWSEVRARLEAQRDAGDAA